MFFYLKKPINFSETYLKGPKAKKFHWNLTIRLRGQEVPLELIYRTQGLT